jgi:hypothetical protein
MEDLVVDGRMEFKCIFERQVAKMRTGLYGWDPVELFFMTVMNHVV